MGGTIIFIFLKFSVFKTATVAPGYTCFNWFIA